MAARVPSINIGRGLNMPIIGLGTCEPSLFFGRYEGKTGKEIEAIGEGLRKAVENAIDIGYRSFDTALAYLNEWEIGTAFANKIAEGVVKREDLIIITKLWNTYHAPEDVRKGVLLSLERLQLDYIDLYLMHWPMAMQKGDDIFVKKEDGSLFFVDVHPTETYKAMEKLVEEGLVKHIGVSNFNNEQLQHILDNATIKPAVNQVEVHPYFTNEATVDFCQSKGIAVMGYSPFGVPGLIWNTGNPNVLDDAQLHALAKKYKKTVTQVIMQWLRQRNIIVIPKSFNPDRMKQNIQIHDFQIEKSDMELINSLDRNISFIANREIVDGKEVYRDRNAPHFPYKNLC